MAIGTQYIGVEARPLDAVMPALPQDIVTGVTGVLVALLYLYAFWQAFSAKRDDRWLIMLVAASITILMEPFACFMVKAHHPAVGAYVLLSGLDVTVPWQLLFFYILYFAPTGAYLMWRASKGVSAAGYWMDFIGIVLLLWAAEALCIWLGVWFFYDYNPFVLAGLPIWVSLTNISAVYAWSVATSYCLDHLKGAARWTAVLAAPFAAIAVYGPVSLPGAVALYRDGAGFDVTGPACAASVLVGLAFIAGARHLLLLSAGRLRSV
ncbi:hypothetical protein [Nevskia sp.]|uniref:hypothetical protein n=1 Tax=Nevskia sp. TaxID=1929292 RepID=UPI0025F90380|nr:hypothetical protein [Nevskia sp.]